MLGSKSPGFYLVIAPQDKSSDAGNLNTPKGGGEALLLSEKGSVCKKNQYIQGLWFQAPTGLVCVSECICSGTSRGGLL